jgi:prepilin-type N-terminal cleavage/methylation domain-containing protein
MKTSFSKKIQRGFTLVEIAIVLMIVGLLIGGVLRGQELITSARVRNMVDQKSSIQTAIISFQDRFKMLPGDLSAAQILIVGNGAIAATAGATQGDGTVNVAIAAGVVSGDSAVMFQNLNAAGFISCAQCTTAVAGAASTPSNTMVNTFGDYLWYGNIVGGAVATSAWWDGVGDSRKVLGSGSSVSSQVLAELDRKADDGVPASGQFRVATYSGGGVTLCSPTALALGAGATAAAIAATTWANPAQDNCAGAWLL